MYAPLAEQAWNAALKAADVTEVDVLCVAGMHARSVARVSKKLGVATTIDLSQTVGDTGTAHACLLLATRWRRPQPGQTVALVSLADGADVLHLPHEPTHQRRSARVDAQIARPRMSPTPLPVVARHGHARAAEPSGAGPRVGARGGARDRLEVRVRRRRAIRSPRARDDRHVHRRSPRVLAVSPPIVFAIVDFDGGGRGCPLELTDVDPDALQVGDRVEMTFRKLSTADGIHNYFWKARPVR